MHETTQERVMAHLLIAFGQGTRSHSISDATVEALRDHYSNDPALTERWDQDSYRRLDQLRTIGRLAALYATQSASTTIEPRMLMRAVREVEMVSGAHIPQSRPMLASVAS